jgi:plastocyanin
VDIRDKYFCNFTRAILRRECLKILAAGRFLNVNVRKKVLSFSTLGGLMAVIGCVQAHASFSNVAGIIIQKARSFGFQSVTLRAGGSIVLSNEEVTAVHHAYIEANGIRRDFGDQGPGTHTTMDFPHTGDFVVLCGVHPKMRLAVHVE